MFLRIPRVTGMFRAVLMVIFSSILAGVVAAQDMEGQPSRDWRLLVASEKGDIGEVRKMLDLSASIGSRDEEFGGTPLHWAAYKGHVNVVEVLLNRGADVTTANNDGRSALVLAAAMGQTAVVKLLLERGADPQARGNDGRNAEDWANHWRRTAVLRLLHPAVAKEADKELLAKPSAESAPREQSPPGAMDRSRVSGLQDKNRVLIAEAGKGNVQHIIRLLEQGADVDAIDRNTGTSALMCASSNGRTRAVKELLARGADVNAVGPEGRTALIMASLKGRSDVVELLLQAKADAKITDARGRTALQWAVTNGHRAVAKRLTKHRETAEAVASTPPKDEQGTEQTSGKTAPETSPRPAAKVPEEILSQEDRNKALADAAEKGRLDEVERLVREGADVASTHKDGATSLVLAATNGHIEVVECLLRNGADLHACTSSGLSALCAAVESGHTAVVELLLAKGADVNATSGEEPTALDRAVRKGSEELKAILLQHGATSPLVKIATEKQPEPPAPPEDKHKALLESAEKGDLDQVRRLLEAGADVNGRASAGNTVLMTAASRGDLPLVKLLLEKGADPRAKDSNGKTALVYADEKGFREVKDFLQEKTIPATKPQRTEKKSVAADQTPPGKHRLGAMSPDTKPAPEEKPK